MKTCKINIKLKNDFFKTYGTGVMLAATAGLFLDSNISIVSAVIAAMLGAWMVLIGVCDE